MARFLLSTMPSAGCVAPAQALAAELVGRGHEVVWHTGGERASLVDAVGATLAPFDQTPSYVDLPPVADPGQRGLAAVNTMMRRLLVDRAPGQLADYESILAGFPADVVVTDGHSLGAHLLHDRGGPPWAVLNETALIGVCPDDPPWAVERPTGSALGRLRNRALNRFARRVALRPVTDAYQRCRARAGLPPLGSGQTIFDARLSPYLFLQPTDPAFEYPRAHLPSQVHLVGPLVPDPPADFVPPPWWGDVARTRPVVLVTQGTTATDPTELVIPAIRALADLAGLVVVTAEIGTPADLPRNVRAATYIPYHALLPHVDVMVTNGGYSGVQLALAHGVPMVAAAPMGDYREISARIAWSGAGVWVRSARPTSARIAAAVAKVLREPAFRENARRIQRAFAASRARRTAGDLLECLAVTRSRVTRRS